jgi:cellulose synthase/poly-beta-1,6-N-acetylglucosamine synthase-like glycosyltransferase
MIGLAYIFFTIYLLSLIFIGIYCLSQFHLLIVYLTRKSGYVPKTLETDINQWPEVTIQLPVFNEKYVVARLIDNIMKIEYPKEKLFIHVLDDSTDETLEISREKVNDYSKKGYNIYLFHRKDRSGYKAGALKENMQHVHSPFVAIFDADFLPDADFLWKTIPVFSDAKTGVVQTRWEHINQHNSLLTEMQAMQLNVHFTVEQQGRFAGNYLLQFNGTAGVWRTETILDAGGWEADTLTEDLDLSYRAQLRGWKIHYLEDVGSPAELPADINGLKSQQFRWMKGGAENAKKLLRNIWHSPLSLPKKFHAATHLLASSVFIAVLTLGLSSVPLMYFIQFVDLPVHYLQIFLTSFGFIVILYFVVNVIVRRDQKPLLWQIIKFLLIFPLFMSMSMALALHNSLAVIQGFAGKKSPFIRTPKYGNTDKSSRIKKMSYYFSGFHTTSIAEAVLGCIFLIAFILGIKSGISSFSILHAMLAMGYFSLFSYAISSNISK